MLMSSMFLNSARACYVVLAVITTVTIVYTCSTDGSPLRSELLTPWMKATLIDLYTNVFVLLVRFRLCQLKRQNACSVLPDSEG